MLLPVLSSKVISRSLFKLILILSSYFFSTNQIFVRVTVANSRPLIVLSEVVGWIYFVAWSVSFYPQIYINFKRKSVVGLNFDFLALNIVGFFMYFLFNAGLFWNKYIQVDILLDSSLPLSV